ncbi:expressed unknown protein [Seminavis robusta]|uniref:RRM domain-containing protein n=1 Tax=Seminavis robusta TaxID=568900 RepID=A0A9N8E592_9STRA|nr:expressed unknown protein [Seminavis robusta]|eukprot:Sro562_g167100.1 n/a (413) ;mRNA; r:40878-42116
MSATGRENRTFVPLSPSAAVETVDTDVVNEEDLPKLVATKRKKGKLKPRPSNPLKFLPKEDITKHLIITEQPREPKKKNKKKKKKKSGKANTRQRRKSKSKENTDIVIAIPTSEWIHVGDISPISTLESMVEGINEALDAHLATHGGIVHVDDSTQLLDFQDMFPNHHHHATTNDDDEEEQVMVQEDLFRWVQQAHLILSSYGRPAGWKVQLANRSIAYALLQQHAKTCVQSTWKPLTIAPFTENTPQHNTNNAQCVQARLEKPSNDNGFGHNHVFYDCDLDQSSLDWIDDSVVRVENCGDDHYDAAMDLFHLFGSYELKAPSILQWTLQHDGHGPRSTYLVRFEDPDWARAAMRDKQGHVMPRSNNRDKSLRLIQFPKQKRRNNMIEEDEPEEVDGDDEEDNHSSRMAVVE